MKQLFHIVGVEKALAKTDAEKLKAEALRLFIEQKMAENMVMNAERDEQGNILLQGIPVHPEDALYFARQDIEHFRDTDKHLSPSGLLAIKDSRNADLNANTAFEFLDNQALSTGNKKQKSSKPIPLPKLPKSISIPPNVDLRKNIEEAKQHYGNVFWFRNQVNYHARWDYKDLDRSKYENFGNFHYGLVGAAMGFSEEFLCRAAGTAQILSKNSKPEWGDPGIVLSGGEFPYGDDPKDQYWIRVGYHYYKKYFQNKS